MAGNLAIANCILWANTDGSGSGEAAQIYVYAGTPVVTYSCIQDDDANDAYIPFGGTGNHNTDDDPLYLDADGGDFRLFGGSPCIDAGDNTCLPEGIEVDLYGKPRFVDDPATPDSGNPDGVNPIVDMGTYEFQPCPGDLDNDGVRDLTDFTLFANAYGSVLGEPSYDPDADMDGDGIIDLTDFTAFAAVYRVPCP
jgi:hypothetical protein